MPLTRTLNFWLLPKQREAMEYLMDPTVTEVLYGGSAGSGKTDFGCQWIISQALAYPGTRWLIGRSKLKQLKGSTMKTFKDVARRLDIAYEWPGSRDELTLYNGSEIVLKDLFFYPSDPEFDSLGSLEITGAYVDEASQITQKAYDVLKSRMRYKLREYNIAPKLLMTTNPSKNFLYTHFYLPHKEGKLPSFRKFVPALPDDNPFLPKSYIESLKNLEKISRERLLYGNWEYDDDPTALVQYDQILQLFNNSHIPDGELWMTVDPSYTGGDSTVILVWNGFKVIDSYSYSGSKVSNEFTIEKIREFSNIHKVPTNHIIVDVGGGYGNAITESFKGSIRFYGSAAAPSKDYANMRTQCFYELASKINKSEIFIANVTQEEQLRIIRELEQLKRDKVDQDGKLFVVSKGKMKDGLSGRSPDWLDALSMRMYPVLSNTTPPLFKFYVIGT